MRTVFCYLLLVILALSGLTGSVQASGLRLVVDSEGRIFVPHVGAIAVGAAVQPGQGELVAAIDHVIQHPAIAAGRIGGDHGAEHRGIAVDTERGLLVPVIHSAGDLNMGGIARKISDLAARTRDNKVSPDELGGGTFTLTNTGSRGALFDTPIINQPQVAILGLGAVVKRPMVVKGEDGGETIAIRSMVYLGLSYDHRVVDGADAARFLVTLKERLEGGAFESDLGL